MGLRKGGVPHAREGGSARENKSTGFPGSEKR